MTFIATLPARPPSRAARWALRLAVLCLLFAVLALLAHHGGMVETPTFLAIAMGVVALSILTMLLILAGLRSLWMRGSKGGRRLAWAMVLMLPMLATLTWGAVVWFQHPVTAQASTDLSDPPLFARELAAGSAEVPPPDADAALDGLRFSAPLDTVLTVVAEVAESNGWQDSGQRGRIGADDEVYVEYAYRTPTLYMPIEIVVRLADEGDTTFIDARAQMLHITHDLGTSARLLTAFISGLDFAMIGRTDP